MRIIIFTDSLGRPRPDINMNDKTLYADVYGYKLKKYFDKDEVELLYIESLDTKDALHWSQRMVAFREPDLVIFHLGINDTVPRIFKKGSRNIIFNPLFRKITFDFFLKFFSYFRYVITKIRPIVYVSKEDFYKNFQNMMDEIKKYNKNTQFIAIGISKSDIHNKKSFGYNKNIIEYNEILLKIFEENYININTIVDNSGLIADNLHLTKESHQELFLVLKKRIEELKCVE